MKIIDVANQKGGVGKTTTVIELAYCLAGEGKKVLIIDFDQQGNTTDNLNGKHEKNIIGVFRQDYPIFSAVQNIAPGVDLIASSEEISKIEKEFSSEEDRDNIYMLADVCSQIGDVCGYDYIIIDNNPDRNTALNMTYVAADYVICPTLADDNSMKGVINISNDIRRLRDTRNHESHAYIIGIIVTMMERFSIYEYGVNNAKEIAESLEGDVFVDTVAKSVRVSEVKSVKGSLQQYDAWCKPASDYRRIAKKIIEREANEKGESR